MVDKVVPRLSRPLETGGRYLKPCPVHGDLCEGNTVVDAISEEPFSLMLVPLRALTIVCNDRIR